MFVINCAEKSVNDFIGHELQFRQNYNDHVNGKEIQFYNNNSFTNFHEKWSRKTKDFVYQDLEALLELYIFIYNNIYPKILTYNRQSWEILKEQSSPDSINSLLNSFFFLNINLVLLGKMNQFIKSLHFAVLKEKISYIMFFLEDLIFYFSTQELTDNIQQQRKKRLTSTKTYTFKINFNQNISLIAQPEIIIQNIKIIQEDLKTLLTNIQQTTAQLPNKLKIDDLNFINEVLSLIISYEKCKKQDFIVVKQQKNTLSIDNFKNINLPTIARLSLIYNFFENLLYESFKNQIENLTLTNKNIKDQLNAQIQLNTNIQKEKEEILEICKKLELTEQQHQQDIEILNRNKEKFDKILQEKNQQFQIFNQKSQEKEKLYNQEISNLQIKHNEEKIELQKNQKNIQAKNKFKFDPANFIIGFSVSLSSVGCFFFIKTKLNKK